MLSDRDIELAHPEAFGNLPAAKRASFSRHLSGCHYFPMTSAADPHDFRTMEITLGPPDKNGGLAGPVILSGQTL